MRLQEGILLSPFSLQGQEVLHIGGQYGLMECIHCVCEAAIFIFPPKFCVRSYYWKFAGLKTVSMLDLWSVYCPSVFGAFVWLLFCFLHCKVKQLRSPKVSITYVWTPALNAMFACLWCRFANDLRPYALVQFVPCLAIPIMAILLPPKYSHSSYWLWAAGHLLSPISHPSYLFQLGEVCWLS